MSESIKSGQHYNITNEDEGLAFDLYDLGNKSVLRVGRKHHGEEKLRASRLPVLIALPSYNRDSSSG
jgi:hypothetical protein